MNPILDLLVPALLVLLMFVVGLGLTGADFVRIRERKGAVVLATVAQATLLPVLAAGLVWVFHPEPHIAAGLVFLAACPGGALSNYYCHLARADVAFSVVLTAVASLASLVTLPFAAQLGFLLQGSAESRVSVPVVRILLQLTLFVLLPILIGMSTRVRWSTATLRWLPRLNRVCLVALVLVLLAVFVDQLGAVSNSVVSIVLLAVLFTFLGFAVGAALGWILKIGIAATSSLALEFSVRNLGVMALVAVTVLGRPDYLLFGAVFLVVQFPIALLATRLIRRVV